MAFPNSIEVHFSTINATPAKTEVTVHVYRVSDGGVDAEGVQQYTRILWRSFNLKLDAGFDRDRLLAALRARLVAWNTESGANVSLANQICNL